MNRVPDNSLNYTVGNTAKESKYDNQLLDEASEAESIKQISNQSDRENVDEYIRSSIIQFTIVSFPNYSKTNPYQDGLYSSFKKNGKVIYDTIEAAIKILRDNPNDKIIFHLHWPEPLFSGVDDSFSYEVRASDFLKAVGQFQSMGGMFIWTVHNRLSHDRRFGPFEVEFLKKLSNAANRIHVHGEAAVPLLNEYYEVDPRKCFVVPHASYDGSYGPAFDKYQSRDILGLAHAEKLLVFFGQIRPYKGIDELVIAFNAATADKDYVHLLIVGKPMSGFTSSQARLIEESNPRIHIREGFVPDSKVPIIMGAADLIVLPYREILTSGSVMLAATYGKPVITPDLPTLSFVREEMLGIQYDQNVDGALEQAIHDGLDLSTEALRSITNSAAKFAKRMNWPNISSQFENRIVESLIPAIETVQVGINKQEVKVIRKNDDFGFIGIALVYYHSWEDINRLSPTIPSEIDGKAVRIYLFDNSSNIQPNYKVANTCDVYVTNFDNIGYAAANNILLSMIKSDGCEYAFILNPDTTLSKDALEILVRNAKPNIVQSPLILDEGRSISYGGGRVRYDHAGQIHVEHLLEHEPGTAAPTVPYSVHVLNGCALFLPCTLLDKIGFIREDYFLYYEETDWCLAARKKGSKLIVEPRATVTHHKRSKAGNFPSISYTYYLLRNKFTFSRAWNKKGTLVDLQAIKADASITFVEPWKEKLAKSYPELIPLFERCVQAAFEDGVAGVTGRINLSERIDEISLPDVPISYGRIDKIGNDTVSGWMCQQGKDSNGWSRTSAWLFKNGSPHSTIDSVSLRRDVAEAGYSAESGFTVNIPSSKDGERHHYEIRMVSDGRQLATSTTIEGNTWPLNVESLVRTPKLKSFIENIADGQITGWAADIEHPDLSVRIDIYVDETLFSANVCCEKFRPDLKRAGIGEGCHAFALLMSNDILLRKEVDVEIRMAGSDVMLQRKKVKVINDPRGFSPKFDIAQYLRWAYIEERMGSGYSETATKLLNQFEMEKLRRLALCDNDMDGPLTSVIMPAFNRENVVTESINSVLQQSYGNFELIVVDDGSTDNTAAVVQKFTDKRVKLIQLEQNVGVSEARNVGLSNATGDIISYLDSDNIWDHDFLKIMVHALVNNRGYSCAYSGQVIYQVIRQGESEKLEQRSIRFAPFNWSRMEERNFIDLNVFVHTRRLYNSLGGFDKNLRRLVDWDLIMRYTRRNVPVMVPCLLSNYFIGKADNQITSVEDFNSNRAALKIPSPIKLLGDLPVTREPLNIFVSCESQDQMQAWVKANVRLLRSTSGTVTGLWQDRDILCCVRMAAADMLDRPLVCDDVFGISRTTDALLDIFGSGAEAHLLFTRGVYAIGGDWHSLLTKTQDQGNYIAIIGRAYGKPKISRFGNIFTDIMPQQIANHMKSWSVNSAIAGQVTRKIPVEYFFVDSNNVPMFLQAAALTEDINAMTEVIFGFADVTGRDFLYTPELVGCEYAEIPDVILS